MTSPGRHAAVVALVLTLALGALAGCSLSRDDDPKPGRMPDLVGMTVGDAEAKVYDKLHTSLAYYDLSPADRAGANDWVVVATSPKASERIVKFTTVYAFALKRSEVAWFVRHPTMPTVPAGASMESLVASNGLFGPVRDLVQLRYQPGTAPATAHRSSVDAAQFVPDRDVKGDPSTEPMPEWAVREGLLEAPAATTVSTGSLPDAGAKLRVGQYLVLLAADRPKPKPRKKPKPQQVQAAVSGSSGSSSSGSKGGGSSGGKGNGGTRNPFAWPTMPAIPKCPKRICGPFGR